jgi:hypothetical protein
MAPRPEAAAEEAPVLKKAAASQLEKSARAALAVTEEPGIDGLNERVAKIVALAAEVGAERAKVEDTALAAVRNGAVVYKHRAKWLVVFYSAVCAYWLTQVPSSGCGRRWASRSSPSGC